MLIQFAHHLAEVYGPNAAIYASTQVSLNGRDPTSLVDRTVDLTKVERGFGRKLGSFHLIRVTAIQLKKYPAKQVA